MLLINCYFSVTTNIYLYVYLTTSYFVFYCLVYNVWSSSQNLFNEYTRMMTRKSYSKHKHK